MSQFTTPAQLEMLDDNKWKVITPFQYHLGCYPSENIIIVPAGFITDLATIPRLFWTIMPPNGDYAKAAIIHDFLYSSKPFSRKRCDDILYEAMGVLNVACWRKNVIYWAVRIFGGNKY